MYLKNAWYAVGFWDMLTDGAKIAITLLGEPVVIYRKVNGSLAALEDRCPHRLAALHLGVVEGDNLRCGYHGILFSAEGKAIEIPGQEMIPPKMCVKSYPVVERSGWIFVWTGDADKANESLLPPVHGLRNPDWRSPKSFLDYEASYELLNDNLTDLSHLSFVHQKSFGTDLAWAATQPRVVPIERGVRFDRWLLDVPPIPPLGKASGLNACDQWVSVDFMAPGVFMLSSAIFPLGTAAACGNGEPIDQEPLLRHYSQQCVTPTGPKTLRYFYSWGPSTDTSTEEEGVLMGQILQAAFLEDKDMLEAQQKIIDLDPTRQPIPLAGDRGVTIFQGLMKKLIREENREPAVSA
jgi:phenylpropionate dioxygenase-like ring-hydroxylating dioxygenase large terminal subunit